MRFRQKLSTMPWRLNSDVSNVVFCYRESEFFGASVDFAPGYSSSLCNRLRAAFAVTFEPFEKESEMTATEMVSRDEAAIRALLDDWAEAAGQKEVARIMSFYAQDVVSFDAIGALQFKGRDAYGAHWDACMQHCPGEMIFKLHEVDVTANGDLAFARFLCYCGTTDAEGKEQAAWMRGTSCLRRIDGKWTIVHEHFSAPFDPESFKAQFDLQPA